MSAEGKHFSSLNLDLEIRVIGFYLVAELLVELLDLSIYYLDRSLLTGFNRINDIGTFSINLIGNFPACRGIDTFTTKLFKESCPYFRIVDEYSEPGCIPGKPEGLRDSIKRIITRLY